MKHIYFSSHAGISGGKEKAMDKHELTELLNHVADGSVSPDDAALKLKMQPF